MFLQNHLECLAAASFWVAWSRAYNIARTSCRSSSENVRVFFERSFSTVSGLGCNISCGMLVKAVRLKEAFKGKDLRSPGAQEIIPDAEESSLKGVRLSGQKKWSLKNIG